MSSTSKHISFFLKRLSLFFIPFVAFISFYAWLDPFYVTHRSEKPLGLHWNRNVESSELYLKNNSHYHYSSFIMGNSKCMAFMAREWGKYISDTLPFHFDASSEDISGIYSKLKYLDETGNPIKNLLLITDPRVYGGTGEENSFGYNADYRIDGSSALKFHYIYFKGFLTNFFFISYIDYSLNKIYRPYMSKTIPNDWARYTYDSLTNDWLLTYRMLQLKKDSLGFYSNKNMFYERNKAPVPFEVCVTPDCIAILEKIKQILIKHHTNYKIILSPMYTQRIANPADVKKLKELFGKNNVFDFSGKNIYTENIGNYFDNNHYKQYIGAYLLKVIYKEDTSKNLAIR